MATNKGDGAQKNPPPSPEVVAKTIADSGGLHVSSGRENDTFFGGWDVTEVDVTPKP